MTYHTRWGKEIQDTNRHAFQNECLDYDRSSPSTSTFPCHVTHKHPFCTVLVWTAALHPPTEKHRSLPNAALQIQTIYNRTLRLFKTQLNIAASVRVISPVLHDRRTAVLIPAGTRVLSLFQTVQTGSGAHVASC